MRRTGISKLLTTRGLIAIVMLVWCVGCATHRIDWASRVGTYTYDDAVLELGPPDKQAKLDTGVIVAEWLTSRGSTVATSAYGFGSNPYWYAAPPVPTYINYPNYYLRLIFGPDGKLQSWKRFTQ